MTKNSAIMRNETFERLCKQYGGHYEATIGNNGKFMLVDFYVDNICLFADDFKKMSEKIKSEHEGRLQYITTINNRIKLCYILYL